MRAYVRKLVNGKTRIGTEGNTVTREYKSVKALVRYGVMPFLKPGETAEVEVHENWDDRYSITASTFEVTKDRQ